MQRLLGLVVAAALVAGVVVLATGDGPYAVRVGAREVSQSTIDDELEILAEHPDFAAGLVGQAVQTEAASVPSDLAASWLTFRVISDVARQELTRRGERITDDDRAATGLEGAFGFHRLPAGFRRGLVERVASVRALQRVLADTSTEEFTRRAQRACPSGRYVSHILVADAETAELLKDQLEEGADFGQLAREHSEDPGSAAAGGELACLDALGEIVEPFAEAATALPLDVVSDPVETEFGWHLILVRGTPSQAELDAVAVDAALTLVREARVRVDHRYGTWDEETGQVLPPTATAGGG